MRYCLKYTKNKYIQEADEILFGQGNDLLDAFEQFPNADFIYEVNDEPNWEYLIMIDKKLKERKRRLVISTQFTKIAQEAKTNNLAFYFSFAINNFADLQVADEWGASYALITAPLFFEQSKLKKFTIPLRYRANIAYNGYFTPFRKNANAAFIRPEDQDLYDNGINTVIEFGSSDVAQEETLYRIYKYDKTWSGDLNILITNLNISPAPMNRMLPEKFGIQRLDCGGYCAEGRYSPCHLCFNQMALANPAKIKNYLDNVILPIRHDDAN